MIIAPWVRTNFLSRPQYSVVISDSFVIWFQVLFRRAWLEWSRGPRLSTFNFSETRCCCWYSKNHMTDWGSTYKHYCADYLEPNGHHPKCINLACDAGWVGLTRQDIRMTTASKKWQTIWLLTTVTKIVKLEHRRSEHMFCPSLVTWAASRLVRWTVAWSFW